MGKFSLLDIVILGTLLYQTIICELPDQIRMSHLVLCLIVILRLMRLGLRARIPVSNHESFTRSWNEVKHRIVVSTYHNGQPHGTQLHFHKDTHQKVREAYYSYGSLKQVQKYDSNGKIAKLITYDDYGRVIQIDCYRDGLMHKQIQYYRKVKSEGFYGQTCGSGSYLKLKYKVDPIDKTLFVYEKCLLTYHENKNTPTESYLTYTQVSGTKRTPLLRQFNGSTLQLEFTQLSDSEYQIRTYSKAGTLNTFRVDQEYPLVRKLSFLNTVTLAPLRAR